MVTALLLLSRHWLTLLPESVNVLASAASSQRDNPEIPAFDGVTRFVTVGAVVL
jgi:hypothetical protein